jgi:hypothetical protein
MTRRDARRHQVAVGAGVSAGSTFTGSRQVSSFVVTDFGYECWYQLRPGKF